MKPLISRNIFVIGVALLVMSGSAFAQSCKEIERTGDVLQIVIPLATYGMTYLFDDSQGRRSFTSLFLSTMGTTYALKYSFPAERPDGGDMLYTERSVKSGY